MDDLPEEIPWRIRCEQLVARVLTFLSRVGAAVVWPFEFCVGFVVRLLVGGVERAEDADFFFSRGLWWLLAPLRWLWSLGGQLLALVRDYLIWPIEVLLYKTLHALFGAVEASEDQAFLLTRVRWAIAAWWDGRQRVFSESTGVLRLLRALLAAPFIAVGYLTFIVTLAFIRTAEFLNLDGVIARLVHWTRPLWYPVAALGVFCWAWFVTRNRRQMAWGIPLVFVLAPAGWILAQNVLWGKSRIAGQYRTAVAAAREAKAFDRLQLYERKLAQLGVNTDVTQFQTALELARIGRLDEAYERMQVIAPEDRPGYANAHLWIIQNVLADRLKLTRDRAREVVGAHLARLADLGIQAAEIDLVRAAWLAQCGRLAEAAALLEPLVHTNPTAAIDRMRLDLLLNQHEEARRDARVVADNMERTKRAGKSLTADELRWWYVAEDVLARKARLTAILDDWLRLERHNQDALALARQFDLAKLNGAIRERTTDPRQLADLIRRLFASNDPPAELRGHLTTLYLGRSNTPSLNEAFGLLLQATDLPPTLTEVLGTAAATEEDWQVAQPLLEQAVHDSPQNATAWNNLAFVLLKQDADLDQALAAAETAVTVEPNNYHFRETRGQILVKLKRWQEAVDDLEFALNGIPQGAAIHASLAEAYEASGNSRLATIHRQMSH